MRNLMTITSTLVEEAAKLNALADLLFCKEEGDHEELFNNSDSANGVSFILRDTVSAILEINKDLEEMLKEEMITLFNKYSKKKAPETDLSAAGS